MEASIQFYNKYTLSCPKLRKFLKSSERFFLGNLKSSFKNKNIAMLQEETVENKSLFSPVIKLGREFYLTDIA